MCTRTSRFALILLLAGVPVVGQEVKVDHDAHRRVQPGDVISVVVQSAARLRAVFSIGAAVRDQPLSEAKPGVYVGEYTVRRGEELNGEVVTATVIAANNRRLSGRCAYRIGDPPERFAVGEGLEIEEFGWTGPEWAGPGAKVEFRVRCREQVEGVVQILGTPEGAQLGRVATGVYGATWTVPSTAKLSVEGAFPVVVLVTRGDTYAMRRAEQRLAVDTAPPAVGPIYPSSGAARRNGAAPVSVYLYDGGSGIDPDRLKLTVDGQDRLAQASYADGFLTWKPAQPLAGGKHELAVEAVDRAGNRSALKWSVEVTGGTISRVTHSAKTKPEPGDVITVTAEGEPGGRATFSIGEGVENIPMRENPAGRYEGTYTVRRDQDLSGRTVEVTLITRDGQRLTAHAAEPIGGPATPVALAPPEFTSHQEGARVEAQAIFRGRAKPGAKVRLTFQSRTSLIGLIDVTGELPTVTVEVNTKGEWETKEIAMTRPAPAGRTTFTITAVAIDGDRESEPAVLHVIR